MNFAPIVIATQYMFLFHYGEFENLRKINGRSWFLRSTWRYFRRVIKNNDGLIKYILYLQAALQLPSYYIDKKREFQEYYGNFRKIFGNLRKLSKHFQKLLTLSKSFKKIFGSCALSTGHERFISLTNLWQEDIHNTICRSDCFAHLHNI